MVHTCNIRVYMCEIFTGLIMLCVHVHVHVCVQLYVYSFVCVDLSVSLTPYFRLQTTLKQEGPLLSLKRPLPRPPRGQEGSTPSPHSSPSNTETDSAASASDDDLCPQPAGDSATVDDAPYPGAHSPEQFSESPGASSAESAQSDLSAVGEEDPTSNGVGPDEETDVGSGRHERLVRPDEPAPTGPLPRGTAVSPRVPRPPCEEGQCAKGRGQVFCSSCHCLITAGLV